MSFRKANHLGLLSLLCYYYAIIADKLIFEKKANDCEKIIQEQCCQLASLTKELECAKGLAEDISLRLSEYESKTMNWGILRILKEEHCQKDAELKEASHNLIVANKKNNSLAEALSEYELKLKEMKEKEKEEHYQKDALLKEASDNLIVANKKNNSLAEALSEYELKLKEMKERNLALDDNASLLKAVKTVNAEESSTLIEDVKGKIQRFCEIESVVEITRTEIIHSKQEESKAIERIKELKEDLISKEKRLKAEVQKLKSSYEEKVAAQMKAKEEMEQELIQSKDEAEKEVKSLHEREIERLNSLVNELRHEIAAFEGLNSMVIPSFF
ncbi:hypothetical protein QYM36_005341 [Artemia franciscana]|uniref:Uncharacterized protein n=1 Tax=Artemia franciscana TaxID=6661 RepID=A0AA88LB86_ARTSF|nr:hypothetical protein QYM36_005341 [Artemia franciscana]